MAPQFRHRAAVLVVFAAAPAFVVAALAAAGPAEAETEAPSPAPVTATATESGKQVVFSGGGLLGVSCAVQPSTRAVTVAADSTLKVVNRTGYRARLTLDGAVQGEIQDSASADVLFRRGAAR